MKIYVFALGVLTLLGLFLTDSMYVEINEFLIIATTLTILSTVIVQSFVKGKNIPGISSSLVGYIVSTFIASALFWVLSIIDIVIDYFVLASSSEKPDGRVLTLKETLQEFSNDLFILNIMIIVIILTSIISTVFTKITPIRRET